MGRSKEKKGPGKKVNYKEKAFVVNTMKKAKTKAVSSNLKKLNLQTKAKTEKANASFKDVHDIIMETAKASTEKPKSSKKAQTKTDTSTEVDMEAAMGDFAKL